MIKISDSHYKLEPHEVVLIEKLANFMDQFSDEKEVYNHPNTLIAGLTTVQNFMVECEPECSMYNIRLVIASGDELSIVKETDYGEKEEVCSGFFEKLSDGDWDFYTRRHSPEDTVKVLTKTVDMLYY